MIRDIIKIDEDLCNGCGLCVTACHEGALQMIDGKAKLVRDDYCDGLGACLPACPTGAITIEKREASAFDEEAVLNNKEKTQPEILACGCPVTASQSITREITNTPQNTTETVTSQLNQWPVQIQLAPVNAPYFNNAHLLVAADCTAFAYGNFHNDYMKNKITIIGCPKLDDVDYSEKLTEILKTNEIKSITIIKMEVPCCNGLKHAVEKALKNCNKFIPWQVITISTDGRIITSA